MEQNFKCSVCGAKMELREEQGLLLCPYCGEIITYEKEQEVTVMDDMEENYSNSPETEYQYDDKSTNSGCNIFANAAGGAMIGVIVVIVIIYFVFMEVISNL